MDFENDTSLLGKRRDSDQDENEDRDYDDSLRPSSKMSRKYI